MKKPKSGIDVLENAYLQETEKFICANPRFASASKRKEREAVVHVITKEVMEHTATLNKLNKEGLERRAVVPTAIFRQLVDKMKLYTFHTMDQDGRVQADLKNFIEQRHTVHPGFFLPFCIGSVVITYLIGYYLNSPTIYQVLPMLGYSCLVLIGRLLLSAIALCGCQCWLLLLIMPDMMLYYIFAQSRKRELNRFKKILWRQRRDTDLQPQSFPYTEKLNKLLQENYVRIGIDAAPQNVQDRVETWRAAGYDPYLVIDERAFSVIMEGTLEVINDIYLRSLRCPIYCLDIGNFTVIIDQYGSFPSEQKIIAFVQQHFSVLKDNRPPTIMN